MKHHCNLKNAHKLLYPIESDMKQKYTYHFYSGEGFIVLAFILCEGSVFVSEDLFKVLRISPKRNFSGWKQHPQELHLTFQFEHRQICLI